MTFVTNFFRNFLGHRSEETAEEEKNAAETITILKKSLEEGQNIARIIETRYTALIRAQSSQMMTKDEQEKALQYGQTQGQLKSSFADEAPESPFHSLQRDMMDAIQMNNGWITRLQQQMNELLKTDLIKRLNALEKETQKPVHRNSELNEAYEKNESDKNETRRKMKSDSSSKKKACLAQKRQVVSLLYCPQKLDLVTSIMKRLDELLITHLSINGFDLKMQICESVQDIREGIPLIVVCLHSSRLGTDVSNALRGIRTGPNVAVIVVHHKDIHALPSTSSDKILTAQEFQRVGAIVDMGFLSQKGFYTCDLNNKAIEALAFFIAGRKGI